MSLPVEPSTPLAKRALEVLETIAGRQHSENVESVFTGSRSPWELTFVDAMTAALKAHAILALDQLSNPPKVELRVGRTYGPGEEPASVMGRIPAPPSKVSEPFLRDLAAKIADELFTDAFGVRADRILLAFGNRVGLVGWSEVAIASRIALALVKALA